MSLRLAEINADIGGFKLKDINLEIAGGDYHVILGPSGAGKSLLLELICGLVRVESGKIELNGRDITHEPIQSRQIGLLFQDNTLFPHRSVFENIAYPIRIRHFDRDAIEIRVRDLAVRLDITGLLGRNPQTLSGGEIQRVSLARTLAMEPELLLLDEPLSSVDVELKRSMTELLRSINKAGQAIVHVTHDVREALSLASHVSVMHMGEVVQSGTAAGVFGHPASRFVASFCGIRNILKAELTTTGQMSSLRLHGLDLPEIPLNVLYEPGSYLVCIPGGEIRLGASGAGDHSLEGRVAETVDYLDYHEIRVDAGTELYINVEPGRAVPLPGDRVMLNFRPATFSLIRDI